MQWLNNSSSLPPLTTDSLKRFWWFWCPSSSSATLTAAIPDRCLFSKNQRNPPHPIFLENLLASQEHLICRHLKSSLLSIASSFSGWPIACNSMTLTFILVWNPNPSTPDFGPWQIGEKNSRAELFVISQIGALQQIEISFPNRLLVWSKILAWNSSTLHQFLLASSVWLAALLYEAKHQTRKQPGG